MPLKKLKICETFTSIQGESTYAGCLCFFIRLAGCNLKCAYCDTAYSRDTESAVERSIAEIVAEVCAVNIPLVEITGGEPLLQDSVVELSRELLKKGFSVLMETNGTLPVKDLPPGLVKIIDCKTPSSGMSEFMHFENFSYINERDEVKFVISDRTDYEYSLLVISEFALAEKGCALLFSPVYGKVPLPELAGWMKKDKTPARMQLQLHKYIWEPERRGV